MASDSVDGFKSVQESSDDGSEFECSPCDYEGVKKEATYYCPQCQDYLCDDCTSVHQKMSATRSHKIFYVSLSPMRVEDKTNADIKCGVQCQCGGKDVTIYCRDHDEVMCLDCKTLKHRNCTCSTIDEACADSDPTDINLSKERMKTLKAKLGRLQQRRNDDAENLTMLSAECRDIMEGIKKEIIKKIEELTDNALDDLAKCCKEQRNIIEHHLKTCDTAFNRMECDCKPFKEAVTSCINPLIFVRNLQLKKTLEQVDCILEDIEKEVKEPCISFDFDERLGMTDIYSLGVVRSAIITDASPVEAGMNIKSVEQIDAKFPDDIKEPCITGSVFMPNGELILCDNNNSSVKVFKADLTQKEQLKLSSEPWDICLMKTNEIVISQLSAKSLLFMTVAPNLQTGSSITLDEDCRGIAVNGGYIYVSFYSGEIRILNRTGQQLGTAYSGFRFQCHHCISVMPTGILYVSEYKDDNIRVLKDDKEISNYNNADISSPMGIYIDDSCVNITHTTYAKLIQRGRRKKSFCRELMV